MRAFFAIVLSAIMLVSCGQSERKIAFAEGTKIPFCISIDFAETSVKAAGEEDYFTAVGRLGSLRKERLCTDNLDMSNIPEMTVRSERFEEDPDTGRAFMIASIPRTYFSTCGACDALRESERLYFIVYNDVGNGEFGWKGYIQYIINNRTASGIFDFLFK